MKMNLKNTDTGWLVKKYPVADMRINSFKPVLCSLPNRVLLCLLAFITASCVEPYNPPAIIAAENYLVVEGFINSGQAPSTFALSRTRTQAQVNNFLPEERATVNIEGENGEIYPLAEKNAGMYASLPLNLNSNSKYRLRIRTIGGKEYVSAYVELKTTPAIDSITWEAENEGVQFYVNTHDTQNNTRYYRWEYEETWEYRSAFYSNLEYKNEDVQYRPIGDQVHTCWSSDNSKEIYLGSSARLAQDVIYRNPGTFTPAISGKLAVRYSLQVKQYALSQDGFEYWQILKKILKVLDLFSMPSLHNCREISVV